jgi:hypothetical protein
MKSRTLNLTTVALLPAALLASASCSTSTPPPPVGSGRITYTKGAPGGEIVQTVETTAIVTAMDEAKRLAKLQTPNRNEFTVKVGPKVVNFGQVSVGDRVNATVVETLVASLDKESSTSGGGTVSVAEASQEVAEVIAIDSTKRTATLRFNDGNNRTFPIRDDLDLNRHKVGERVVFRFTERIAIKIEKLPK